jgi:membrane-bound serine protease (ClpP class)
MANSSSRSLPPRTGWHALLFLLGLLLAWPGIGQDRRTAILLDIDGAIGPASADYFLQGLERARQDSAELVILRMDTPGGLDSSMRDIIKAILSSPVPVVSYVAPSGSRAASAGTYILYASHVAAMAPATHLGAATPVQIGGPPGLPDSPADRPPQPDGDQAGEQDAADPGDADTDAPRRGKTAMERKVLEDAVAYIRGLAQRYGRNADWAEQAVREAVSLTAQDALEQNVIDLMADDVPQLLEQLHGRSVRLTFGDKTLDTEGVETVSMEPDWRNRLLSVITNPNIAYLLMLVGIYGIIFELANPGTIVSGVIGAICLVLALYAFQLLPINYAGLALIILGLMFIIAEAFVPSFGILGIGGVIAFVAGSVILVDDDAWQVSLPLIAGTALFTGAFLVWGFGRFMTIRRHKVGTGREEMVGAIATVVKDFEGEGPVWLHSERWTAVCDRPLRKDQPVRVTAIDGLKLRVEPVAASEH